MTEYGANDPACDIAIGLVPVGVGVAPVPVGVGVAVPVGVGVGLPVGDVLVAK